VPFDQAVTHRTGTRFGPRAIREASALQPFDPPYGWPTNPLEEMTIVDYGDVAFDYAHTPSFPGLVTDHIRTILSAGAGSITLGGDHFITLPILRAYAEKFSWRASAEEFVQNLQPYPEPERGRFWRRLRRVARLRRKAAA
jgi:agmatinase